MNNKIFEDAIVEKTNQLNQMRLFNMDLQELRIFTVYLSLINHKDKDSRYVRFLLSDFVKLLGVEKVNKKAIENSADKLLKQIVTVPNSNGGWSKFQLFSECVLEQDKADNNWYIKMNAHDKALPLMFDFKDKYFKYRIGNVVPLKSNIQIRMYEILKQYEKIGSKIYTVEELRFLLGVEDNEYPVFNDFKRKIIDKSKDAIAKQTDICFEYECASKGPRGKWLSIKFTIKSNPNYKRDDKDSAFIGQEDVIETDFADDNLSDYQKDLQEREIKSEKYKNPNIEFFACACDYDFSETEMEHILSLIANRTFPEHPMGKDFAKEDYLYKLYTKFKVYAEKSNLDAQRRFSYFCKMLENDSGI